MKYIAMSMSFDNLYHRTDEVLAKVKEIAENYASKNGEVTLIHGFLPLETLKTMCIPPTYRFLYLLGEVFDEYFPKQLHANAGDIPADKVHHRIVELAKDNMATVYIIGDVVAGVTIEAWLCEKERIDTKYISLDS